jgi:hypothetical protein
MREWAMEGAGSPSVVPQVRHWIQEVLWNFPQDLRDRVEIIASEYTTNCVRHSTAADGGDIHLRVTVSREKVRIEVRDGGPRQTASDVWKPEEATISVGACTSSTSSPTTWETKCQAKAAWPGRRLRGERISSSAGRVLRNPVVGTRLARPIASP